VSVCGSGRDGAYIHAHIHIRTQTQTHTHTHTHTHIIHKKKLLFKSKAHTSHTKRTSYIYTHTHHTHTHIHTSHTHHTHTHLRELIVFLIWFPIGRHIRQCGISIQSDRISVFTIICEHFIARLNRCVDRISAHFIHYWSDGWNYLYTHTHPYIHIITHITYTHIITSHIIINIKTYTHTHIHTYTHTHITHTTHTHIIN